MSLRDQVKLKSYFEICFESEFFLINMLLILLVNPQDARTCVSIKNPLPFLVPYNPDHLMYRLLFFSIIFLEDRIEMLQKQRRFSL